MNDEAIINEINEILAYLEDEGEYLLDKDCDTEWLLAVKEVLNLTNRQQSEIGLLRTVIEKLKWEKDHLKFKVDDLNGKLEKFKEYRDIKNRAYEREIERLQAEIKQAKSEAIKEFAERLKKEAVTKCDWDNCVDVEDIDRLVAEMVGGKNA